MTRNEPSPRSDLTVVGEKLKELRNLRGTSQVELAAALRIGQTALSHAESRSDMKFSTLRDYLAALGGALEVVAHFPDLGRHVLLAPPEEATPDHSRQLSLPGIPTPASSTRDVVLSVKPQYAERILDGSKTVELRRRFSAAIPAGVRAWIYSTTPTKAMIGSATIGGVEQHPISVLWRKYKDLVAIKRAEFESYFEGRDEGYAIMLTSPSALRNPIPLAQLRNLCEFEPPQSYQYAPPHLGNLIDGYRTEASN